MHCIWYRDGTGNAVGEKSENSGIFIPILNLLVAISNGIWAVKLCSNNFLYLLSGVAG